MCGIIAGFNTRPKIKGGKEDAPDLGSVNKFIIEQFDSQMGRGEKGFGIIRIDPKTHEVELDRSVGTMKFMLDLYQKESPMIIAHHRMPSSSENTRDQTHPMVVSNPSLKFNYYVIHNGVISNTKDLYKKHTELGFEYKTEHEESYSGHYKGTTYKKWNDSESLAIEIALMLEGYQNNIETMGSATFIVLQMTKDWKAKTVYFARHINPLNMSNTRGKMRLSSEGEGNEINEDTLYSFDINDPNMKLSQKKIEFKPFYLPSNTPKETSSLWGKGSGTSSQAALPSGSPADKGEKDTKNIEDEAEKKAIEDWMKDELEEFQKQIKGAPLSVIEERTHDFIEDMRSYIDDTLEEYIEKSSDINTTANTDIREAMIPIGRFVRMIRNASLVAQAEIANSVELTEGEIQESHISSISREDDTLNLPEDMRSEDVNPEDLDVHGNMIVDETTGFRFRKKKEEDRAKSVLSPYQDKGEKIVEKTYESGKPFHKSIVQEDSDDGKLRGKRRGKFGFSDRSSRDHDHDHDVHGGGFA